MESNLPAIKMLMKTLPKRVVDKNGNLYELVVEFNTEVIGEDMADVYYRGIADVESLNKTLFPIKEKNKDIINSKIMEIEDNIMEKGMFVMKPLIPKLKLKEGDSKDE